MTQLLVIAFRKQFAGKAHLKINLLVKTPLHRRSMEVRRSGLWAPVKSGYWNSNVTEIKEHMTLHANKQVPISGDISSR